MSERDRTRFRASQVQGEWARLPPPGETAPRAPIDLTVLRNVASLGATIGECATVLSLTEWQLNSLRRTHPEVREAMEQGREMGKVTLRRMQWDRAKRGSDVMLIWLGKQLLDQRDKAELELNDNVVHRVISDQPMTEEEWLAKHAPGIDGEAPAELNDIEGEEPGAEDA